MVGDVGVALVAEDRPPRIGADLHPALRARLPQDVPYAVGQTCPASRADRCDRVGQLMPSGAADGSGERAARAFAESALASRR